MLVESSEPPYDDADFDGRIMVASSEAKMALITFFGATAFPCSGLVLLFPDVNLSVAVCFLRAHFVAATSLLSYGVTKSIIYLHQPERRGVFLAMGCYGTQWRFGGPVRDESVWSLPQWSPS